MISSVLIFTDFERWIFKIGIFRQSKIFTPIDSPHRELQIRFLSVKNGFELIILRSDEVDVFFRPLFFFVKKCNTLYCNAHYTHLFALFSVVGFSKIVTDWCVSVEVKAAPFPPASCVNNPPTNNYVGNSKATQTQVAFTV